MKKNLLRIKFCLILTGILSLLISCEKGEQNDWQINGLNGKVKTLTTNSYHVQEEQKFGQWKRGLTKMYGHEKISFDSNGHLISTDVFEFGKDLIFKVIPKRKEGKLVEENYYNKEGTLIEKIIISYSGNKIKWEKFNDKNEKFTEGITIRKNHRNVKVTMTEFEDGEVTHSTIYWEYDNNNNMSSYKLETETEGIIVSQHYEYTEFDEHNNWLKALVYEEGETEPSEIQIRKIEYY